MSITYMGCPKCDDEFEFDFHIAADRSIETWDVKQNCDCEFTEAERDEIEKQACDKFCEL
jgi:hypothetical protein